MQKIGGNRQYYQSFTKNSQGCDVHRNAGYCDIGTAYIIFKMLFCSLLTVPPSPAAEGCPPRGCFCAVSTWLSGADEMVCLRFGPPRYSWIEETSLSCLHLMMSERMTSIGSCLVSFIRCVISSQMDTPRFLASPTCSD